MLPIDCEVSLMMLMAYLSYMLAEVPKTTFYVILFISLLYFSKFFFFFYSNLIWKNHDAFKFTLQKVCSKLEVFM